VYRALTALSFVVIGVIAVACGGGDAMKHAPDAYRPQIEKLESLLSKPQSEDGDCGRLHTMSADLAGAVAKDIEHHQHREIVTNRLVGFGQEFATREEQGLPCDLGEARGEWKVIRTELFQEADWFRGM
jgi:hypothetical protein